MSVEKNILNAYNRRNRIEEMYSPCHPPSTSTLTPRPSTSSSPINIVCNVLLIGEQTTTSTFSASGSSFNLALNLRHCSSPVGESRGSGRSQFCAARCVSLEGGCCVCGCLCLGRVGRTYWLDCGRLRRAGLLGVLAALLEVVWFL
jgi:hypothetical protein